MERRAQDERISSLEANMLTFQKQLQENTDIMKQVRDVLTSFKLAYKVAKWLAVVSAAITALYHGIIFIRGQ